MKKVYFGKRAYNKIQAAIAASGFCYEIGGVLLGYRFLNFWYIKDATIPEGGDVRSKIGFHMDSKTVKKAIVKIQKNSWIPIRTLGLWHSHICDIRTFSYQDRKTNQAWAHLMNGIVSVIITPKGKKDLRFNIYEIRKKENEWRKTL